MAFWTTTTPGTRDPKRAFRFLLQVPGIAQAWAVKKCSKPGFTVKEIQHIFLNHRFYYPGRVEWSDVTVSLVDPIEPNDTTLGVVQWLATAGYRIPSLSSTHTPYTLAKSKAVFNNPAHYYGAPGGKGADSGGNFVLKQIDAEGNSVDEWTLFNAWIQSAKFGENSYDSEDMLTVDLTIKYDFANYEHKLQAVNTDWKDHGVPISNSVIPGNPEK